MAMKIVRAFNVLFLTQNILAVLSIITTH